MPLTSLQRQVFDVIRSNRSPDSFIFGALVFHAKDGSLRYSRDIDVSHDIAASVATSAQADSAALGEAGFAISWLVQQPTFQRAAVTLGAESVLLEWVFDSAFRFFPVEADPELGYRLHHFDAATNKILALASRAEPRDLVDAMHLHQTYLSLGALAWAAAGKDEGLSPLLILDLAERFAHYRQADLDSLALTTPLDIVALSSEWRRAVQDSRAHIVSLPPQELGCAYLDEGGVPVEPRPEVAGFAGLQRHFGSVGGAWPRIAE